MACLGRWRSEKIFLEAHNNQLGSVRSLDGWLFFFFFLYLSENLDCELK